MSLVLSLGTDLAQIVEPVEINARTTAYTHSESDHLVWGRKTAIGTTLKYTKEYTSAAADWSFLPVGTEFRIAGSDRHYVVDDYGGALVGRKTVDLYFPTKREMNRWGLRYVDLEITKWGDFKKSRKILAGRSRYRHCRAMLTAIDRNDSSLSEEFLDRENRISETIELAAVELLNRPVDPSVFEPIKKPEPLPIFGPDLAPEFEMVSAPAPPAAPQADDPGLSFAAIASRPNESSLFFEGRISPFSRWKRDQFPIGEGQGSVRSGVRDRIERVVDPAASQFASHDLVASANPKNRPSRPWHNVNINPFLVRTA